MDRLKSLLVVITLVFGMLIFSPAQGNAQNIGIVDADNLISNYSEAQKVEAELKAMEAELKIFVAEAEKKINNASTPVEQSNMKKQLGDEYTTKHTEFRKKQLEASKKINDDILAAIETVAKTQKIDLVLAKGAVFFGGTDITDSVLKTLNAK